jgi:hypothetical protein
VVSRIGGELFARRQAQGGEHNVKYLQKLALREVLWYTCSVRLRMNDRQRVKKLLKQIKGKSKMRFLGKDGILYIALAICVYFLAPIVVLIMCPFIWAYEKITGKEF